MAHVQAKSFILAFYFLPQGRTLARVYSGVYASVPILFLGVGFMTLVGPPGCMMLLLVKP